MLNRLVNAVDGLFVRLADPLLFLARLVLAWWFGSAGLEKLGSGYASAAALMEGQGIPGALLPLVIALELGGAALLAVGLLTRITALALAAFTVAADLVFNTTIGSAIGGYLVEAELTVVAGFLALMAVGPGRWSLDAWRNRGRLRSLAIA